MYNPDLGDGRGLLLGEVRNARNEQARNQPPKSSRALFRLLRETMAAPAADGKDEADEPPA